MNHFIFSAIGPWCNPFRFVSQVPANLAQDLLRKKEMLDPHPQQASDNDFMALTITEEPLNVFKVPSSHCFIININSYFITFILGLRQHQ